jgi:two-component system phosphate regulon sensor histidine kinase PhoR
VSHELKTLRCSSIIGSAELMENGNVKKKKMSSIIGHIRKEASRLVFLIVDIIRLLEWMKAQKCPGECIAESPFRRNL